MGGCWTEPCELRTILTSSWGHQGPPKGAPEAVGFRNIPWLPAGVQAGGCEAGSLRRWPGAIQQKRRGTGEDRQERGSSTVLRSRDHTAWGGQEGREESRTMGGVPVWPSAWELGRLGGEGTVGGQDWEGVHPAHQVGSPWGGWRHEPSCAGSWASVSNSESVGESPSKVGD